MVGFRLRNLLILQPIPPNRTLWSGRKSPTAWGRIVRRSDGGSDLRLSLYGGSFPFKSNLDAETVRLFDEWLDGLAAELGISGWP